MQITITVTGGNYSGTTYTGALHAAPVTALIPEGIVSTRTFEEAARVREVIARALETHDAVELTAVGWAIRAERVVAE